MNGWSFSRCLETVGAVSGEDGVWDGGGWRLAYGNFVRGGKKEGGGRDVRGVWSREQGWYPLVVREVGDGVGEVLYGYAVSDALKELVMDVVGCMIERMVEGGGGGQCGYHEVMRLVHEVTTKPRFCWGSCGKEEERGVKLDIDERATAMAAMSAMSEAISEENREEGL